MTNDNTFEYFAVEVDSDCVTDDFDNYDLYGDKVEESDDTFGDNLELE